MTCNVPSGTLDVTQQTTNIHLLYQRRWWATFLDGANWIVKRLGVTVSLLPLPHSTHAVEMILWHWQPTTGNCQHESHACTFL